MFCFQECAIMGDVSMIQTDPSAFAYERLTKNATKPKHPDSLSQGTFAEYPSQKMR
jgi:hypothetical protein